jgi:hypothetical protein
LTEEKKDREGEIHTRYYHGMAAAVKPGEPVVVLLLIPEFMRNGGGKRDGERKAAKRRIKGHGERHAPLKPTVLGGDLHCCRSIGTEVREAGMSFLPACKEGSHPRIAGQVRQGEGGGKRGSGGFIWGTGIAG